MDMEKLVFVFSLFIAVLFSLVSCNLENNSTTWFDTLPKKVRNSILWEGDCEEGNFWDWEYDDKDNAGGGIFNTGGEEGVRTHFRGSCSLRKVQRCCYRYKMLFAAKMGIEQSA